MYLYEKKFAHVNDEDTKKELIKVEVLLKKLDEEVASYMVEGFGGVMTKLSSEQADYISVPKEGPLNLIFINTKIKIKELTLKLLKKFLHERFYGK